MYAYIMKLAYTSKRYFNASLYKNKVNVSLHYDIKLAFRRRYYKTKRRYVVFAGSVLIQFIGVAMPSAMLGIVYVDMTREFRAEASQAALMLSLFRGIAFGGGLSLSNNYTCSITMKKIVQK